VACPHRLPKLPESYSLFVCFSHVPGDRRGVSQCSGYN
jgi:hypothetical protein